MGKVEPYHSARGAEVYHDRDDCPEGCAIPEGERRAGRGGRPRCFHCASATSIESAKDVSVD